MTANETIEWAGYKMKQHPQHKDAVIVVDAEETCNPMPGGTYFSNEADAKKGIAALKLSIQTGGDFWMFIELTR